MHRRFFILILLGSMGCVASCSSTKVPGHGQWKKPSEGLAAAVAQAESATATGLQTSESRTAYASSIERIVSAWATQPVPMERDRPVTVEERGEKFIITAHWPASMRFDELIVPPAAKDQHLSRVVARSGVGAPYVARWAYSAERKIKEPFLPEAGYLSPATVTANIKKDASGARLVTLRVHDPRTEDEAVVGGRSLPLAANFSAVGELIVSTVAKNKHLAMSAMGGLRNSEKYLEKVGILSLEPPSRDRIPVIFVHGLMSRPLTWQNAFNELGADPVIRKNYQIYFFRYPTGVPVIYSSAKFRQQLSLLDETLNQLGNQRGRRHMVLIGHSMGGLVSKMQLTSSGDRLWVTAFGAKPSDLGLSREELDSFRQYLEFKPNPHVDRVIFVCTPHRGSKMAQGLVGALGRRLVKLPGRLLGNTFNLVQGKAPDNSLVKQLLQRGVPSSIENLSPESKFVQESVKLPLKPGLHIHSIVGNKDGRLLTDPKASDGVVPYTSAHIEGAESELVVKANHGAHETPEAIAELHRILVLHLAVLGR